jgi:hypothetical protein
VYNRIEDCTFDTVSGWEKLLPWVWQQLTRCLFRLDISERRQPISESLFHQFMLQLMLDVRLYRVRGDSVSLSSRPNGYAYSFSQEDDHPGHRGGTRVEDAQWCIDLDRGNHPTYPVSSPPSKNVNSSSLNALSDNLSVPVSLEQMRSSTQSASSFVSWPRAMARSLPSFIFLDKKLLTWLDALRNELVMDVIRKDSLGKAELLGIA